MAYFAGKISTMPSRMTLIANATHHLPVRNVGMAGARLGKAVSMSKCGARTDAPYNNCKTQQQVDSDDLLLGISA